jgi:hypothetical protein
MSAAWIARIAAGVIRPASATARCIAATFATTSSAFEPYLASPISASASAREPTVMFSICDDDAASVRNSTEARSANPSLPSNIPESSASNRVASARASSAAAVTASSKVRRIAAINGGTAA